MMSAECRVKCSGCHGRGYETCTMCDATGWVCPGCRGMQWVRTGKIEGGTYTIARCETCLTPTLKMEAVKRYMDRWQRDHAPQPAAVPEEAESHD